MIPQTAIEVREEVVRYLENLQEDLEHGNLPPYPEPGDFARELLAQTCAETGGHARGPDGTAEFLRCSYCRSDLLWPARRAEEVHA